MDTRTFDTYAEAQDAINFLRQRGVRAIMLNEHTGGMRDVNDGFKILIETAHNMEQEVPPASTVREKIVALPRTIAWILMCSSALILIMLVIDWVAYTGQKAVMILTLGILGTAACCLAALFWGIVLSDATEKYRNRSL